MIIQVLANTQKGKTKMKNKKTITQSLKQRHSKLILTLCILFPLLIILSSCAVTVTFDPNGATVVQGELKQKLKDGEKATPPVLEKEGFGLVGWDGNYETPEDDITVKAIWKPLFKVTFDVNGGVAADESKLEQYIPEGTSATLPEVSRLGYDFDGWDIDTSNITTDLTAKAKWTRIYTNIYDANGGILNDDKLKTQTLREDVDPIEPIATKDNYIFKEWKKKVNQAKGEITYVAVWERKTFTASEIYAMANPATVEITTFRRNNIHIGLGSGFFISDDGTLVTNYHVIEDAYEIKVKLHDSTEYKVTKVISYNEEKDLAILKIDSKGKKVNYLEYADETSKVGEAVYALGSSLGLTGTFSSGIISYVDREIGGVKFIQSTAPISSGNSGGPLLNEKGLVIGINTASYTEGQNLNLSVSVTEVKKLNTSNISVSSFFSKTAIFPYYVGELCKTVKENGNTVTMLDNGYTAIGSSSYEDIDFYLTKIDSKTKYFISMMAVDDPNAVITTMPIIVAGKSTNLNDMVAIEDFDMYIFEGYDGKYISMFVAEIPSNAYSSGYTYYGTAVTGVVDAKTNYDYQCMICAIDQNTHDKIVYNYS